MDNIRQVERDQINANVAPFFAPKWLEIKLMYFFIVLLACNLTPKSKVSYNRDPEKLRVNVSHASYWKNKTVLPRLLA